MALRTHKPLRGLRAGCTAALLGSGLVLPSPAASAAAVDTGRAGQRWPLIRLDADTTPPTAPAGPRTSELTCTGVVLSWSASSDDVGAEHRPLGPAHRPPSAACG